MAVEKGATPRVPELRRLLLKGARALTNPLRPDDYIELMNPMWSTRELRGTIEEVRPETPDAATVVIRPSFPWPGHKPGQYLRIGVELGGIRHWRAYSLTSDPEHPEGLVSITVKYVEQGKMSPFFVRQVEPGTLVYLGEVEGVFYLPDELPKRAFFLSAGSGITPIVAMLREIERRHALDDVVHVHCTRTHEASIFGPMLRAMDERHDSYRLVEHLSSDKGRITPADLDSVCADWREREAFLSGPSDLLTAMRERWEAEGKLERFHLERFQPVIGTGDFAEGSGGTVHFRITDVDAECDQGISILVGGEDAGATLPFGCRMGICHTCVGRLCEGTVRDLRTGDVHGEEGEMIRTCVHAPEGHVEVEL